MTMQFTESAETDLIAGDAVNRRQWANVIAALFVSFYPIDVLRVIAASGEEEFIRKAHPILANQHLKSEDYRRIYRVVKYTARTGKRPAVDQILTDDEH